MVVSTHSSILSEGMTVADMDGRLNRGRGRTAPKEHFKVHRSVYDRAHSSEETKLYQPKLENWKKLEIVWVD